VSDDETLIARADAALMPTYGRLPVVFTRGEGVHLYDRSGRAFIDCVGGISMINVGHAHPHVVAAIVEQAGRLINTSNLFYTEPQVRLAEWIRDRSIGGKVFFCNSGAEANEGALKLARRFGGAQRTDVVAITDGFHGRTYGALSLTGQPGKQEAFRPLVPGVTHVDRNDYEGLDRAIGNRTCAVILETIQGESGVWPLDREFIARARELSSQRGALLIFDEIQTGLSRTGPLFSFQDLGIAPDVMTLAKSLGGGVPIGAVVAAPPFADTFRPGDHGSTFAGGALACAAAVAACEVVDDPELQVQVRSNGDRLKAGLQPLVDRGLATQVRGRGLMVGIDLAGPHAGQVVSRLLAAGVLVNNTSDRTLRFLPPLVITAGQIDAVVEAVVEAVSSV
jgi:acetylornithine aminotransferase